jgi:hypothetical protein
MRIAYLSAFVSSAIIFIISLCYVIIKICYAYRRKSRLQTDAHTLPLNSLQIKYVDDTINRAKTFYISYLLHSNICFLSRLFSAIFTVCGFYMTNSQNMENIQLILSVLSVFFVLLSVYLIPQDKSRQYLLAWRKLDGHILSLLLTNYKSMSETEIEELFFNSNQLRTDLESSLKNDEDK